jgi:hypothetical protein
LLLLRDVLTSSQEAEERLLILIHRAGGGDGRARRGDWCGAEARNCG